MIQNSLDLCRQYNVLENTLRENYTEINHLMPNDL